MTLVKFETMSGDTIYINSETVTGVSPCSGTTPACDVYTTGRNCFEVLGNIELIKAKLQGVI